MPVPCWRTILEGDVSSDDDSSSSDESDSDALSDSSSESSDSSGSSLDDFSFYESPVTASKRSVPPADRWAARLTCVCPWQV